jgi:aconitate hydratase
VIVTRHDGSASEFNVTARLNSLMEIAYYKNKGILQYVLRSFLAKNKT